jgi:hypothetical protein
MGCCACVDAHQAVLATFAPSYPDGALLGVNVTGFQKERFLQPETSAGHDGDHGAQPNA